jgi:SAM-dependent methyltransferase
MNRVYTGKKREVRVRLYWNRRFTDGGKIWGDSPSGTALRAGEFFRKEGARKILIPGCGYGRHTEFFADEGFTVHGIEISDVAIGLVGRADSRVVYFRGSVLDMPFSDDLYDAVYNFNLLHFFRAADRRSVVEKCADRLREGGLLFFTVFSEKEPTCGKGLKVEEYTYESKPGRPTHYFTEADLMGHFAGFGILETGLVEDRENHGDEGPHTHHLRYMIARKG